MRRTPKGEKKGMLVAFGGFNRGLVDRLLKMRGLMNWMVKMKMSNGKLKHTIKQTLFLTKKSEPIDAVEWMMGMNKDHLHSELVTQDVLLAGGEHDAFQPPMLMEKQRKVRHCACLYESRTRRPALSDRQHRSGVAGDAGLDGKEVNNFPCTAWACFSCFSRHCTYLRIFSSSNPIVLTQ